MKNRNQRAIVASELVFLASIAIFATACSRPFEFSQRQNMTTPSPRIESLFEKTKSVCFGRFIVDVPLNASIVYGPAEVVYETGYLAGQASSIARRIDEHLVEVEKDRRFISDVAKMPAFGTIAVGTVPGHRLVVGSSDGVGYNVVSFIPVGPDLYIQRANWVSTDSDELKETIDELNMVAGYFVPRADGEVPSDDGMCIEGGFIPLPLSHERISIGVRLQEFPDVHFSVMAHKNQNRIPEASDLETLLERAERVAKMQGLGATYANITTFRRGPRQLREWEGYEILARKPVFKNDTDAHEFRFRSVGAINDPLRPELDVQLDTGVRKNQKAALRPSITDEEAVALWDKLIGTIRVRKPQDATSVKPAKVPLGALVPSGQPCSHTGLWHCIDRHVGDGKPVHLAEGELMPLAVVTVPPTFWQKLRGEQPTHRHSVTWQLAAYDDATAPDAQASSTNDLTPSLPSHEEKNDA